MSNESERMLKGLNYKARSIKSAVTKFNSFLETISAENFNAFKINVRLSNIKELWPKFYDIQTQIDELREDSETETDDQTFEDQYFDSIARAEELLATHSKVNSQCETNSQKIADQPQEIQNNIRLPQISLPSFSGNFEEWIPFYDTFISLIHSSESLSKVQKFHYLKSCLKGEAASCIQELQISISNYDIAWGTLKERFDNKRIIVKKHVHAIHELPNCTHESLIALRQILDGVQKHTRALEALGRPVEHWDDWLVYLITSKIDKVSNKEWESNINTNHIPTFKELLKFLIHKCNTLEVISKGTSYQESYIKPNKFQKAPLSYISRQEYQCVICKANHFIYQCPKFLSMSVQERTQEVKSAKLCLNCFKLGHQAKKCNSTHCKKCNYKHNTLLHSVDIKMPESQATNSTVSNSLQEPPSTTLAHTSSLHEYPQILLSTAMIKITDSHGKFHQCRVLLDSGSQSNFISLSLVQRLKLKERSINMPVSGIGQTYMRITKSVSITIKSNYNEYYSNLNCLVLDNITNDVPSGAINKHCVSIPHNLKLADPEFNRPRKVDLLIGAELFWQLLCIGQIKLANTQAVMQKTQLGWIIAGPLHNKGWSTGNICNLALEHTLDAKLSRFWEIEECNNSNKYTAEELDCENHFINNYKRNYEGRFIVKLPIKDNSHTMLGNSKELATKRFYAIERKLLKQPELREQYVNFMDEYLQLGHMKAIQDESLSKGNTFYLPHHAVIKDESLTTKLRVVFDASAKSTSGHALNDTLMVGPSVQEDLFSITCRFRTHKIVLTADITKMYRQILIDPSQTPLQRIIWRSNPTHELQTYELETVTYGTASASFLATRSLKQLAIDEANVFPLGAKIVKRDFYVDDLLTGSDTLNDVRTIFNEVNALLERGGFKLRKWASNSAEILNELFPNATEPTLLNLDKNGTIKTLGLQWNSASDKLQYTIPQVNLARPSTKRSILSQIAQIFNPLGLIGPVIVKSKILMQTLWQLKVSWDETLPAHIHTEWVQLRRNLAQLNLLNIIRNAIPFKEFVELHGFCDASEEAYGACIYVRSANQQGQVTSTLLCSKSKVAPLKPSTIPRLVEPARPFINTGVDYCGPFLLRSSTRRKAVPTRAYIAIFICMAVKAVHIELVPSLDTDSFINAVKRFIARHGMIANIYSDNGANFVRANKEFKDLHKMFTTSAENEKITRTLTRQGISWHFIPPRAPHFGGIWEAAVKAFKYHFKRIISNVMLTYDEFTTISTQIEAMLNSRPLIPLSEDPNDMSALTPGHSLIGDSLRCNLEPSLVKLQINHLSRLQLIELLKQHLWQRWSKEYLQQLQTRQKWTKQIGTSPQVGQLAILKEDNTSLMLWPMGRVICTHPGKDCIVRAVTIKTSRGEVKRPPTRLCILPMQENVH